MKKIISIIGLSIAFTVSPALAENLMDPSPLTFSETRKTYIKPFVGYGISPTQVLYTSTLNSSQLSDLDFSELSNILSKVGISMPDVSQVRDMFYQLANMNAELTAEAQLKVNHVLFGGIDIGRDINDYFGIAGEITIRVN